MKKVKYVTATWLIAVAIHPLVVLIGMKLFKQQIESSFLISFCLYAFFFSIPSYMLCLLAIQLVRWMGGAKIRSLIVWIIATVVCVELGFAFTLMVLPGTLGNKELFIFSIPGCIAAVVAILIQYRQFFDLIKLNPEFVEPASS